jgi:hypothetical protein
MTTVDLDLSGLLRLRLVDVTHRDRDAVVRQLGCPAGPVEGEADLTIHYVERLTGLDGTRYRIGPDDARWIDDGLALARGSGPSRRWSLVPFDRIGSGDPIEIVCEHGIGGGPLLMTAINLVLLARGVLPAHASSFVVGGRGVVAAGWSKSGKTEALLAFMNRGARIVADEWTYVRPDGTLVGLPTPIRLEPWHLAQRPALLDRLHPAERRRIGRLAVMRRGRSLARNVVARGLPGRRVIDEAFDLVLAHDHADVPPAELFEADRAARDIRPDVVFWMTPRDSESISTTVLDGADFATRMAIAHVHHRREFLDAYWRFCYAFPERRNGLVDTMEERERTLLAAMVADREIVRIEHPKPVDLDALADAMAPHIQARAAT